MESLFEELHRQSIAMKGEFRRSFCDSLIHSILSLAHLESWRGERPSLRHRLERARERLGEEVPGPGVEELASQCHLSQRHFCRSFFRTFGITSREFRLSMMIERAKSHLLEGDQSISEISTDLGYRDSFSFSRLFKQKTGHSPLKWRRENR